MRRRWIGFQRATADPPDHVSVQADFMGYLRLKEAYALSQGEHEAAGVAADAARTFLAGHLGDVAARLCADLRGGPVEYLAEAGELLARMAGVDPNRAVNSPLPVIQEEPEEDFSCEQA